MALLSRVILCAAALLALAIPATASAASGCGTSNGPTGNSEVDQYAESIPGPCGKNQPTPGGGGGGGSAGNGSAGTGSGQAQPVIPAGTKQQLESKGDDGKKAAALAEGTAPAPTPVHEAGNTSSDTNDQGVGLLLPLILAAALGAGIVYFLMRRRTGLAS
jgi:hypothetical protein